MWKRLYQAYVHSTYGPMGKNKRVRIEPCVVRSVRALYLVHDAWIMKLVIIQQSPQFTTYSRKWYFPPGFVLLSTMRNRANLDQHATLASSRDSSRPGFTYLIAFNLRRLIKDLIQTRESSADSARVTSTVVNVKADLSYWNLVSVFVRLSRPDSVGVSSTSSVSAS